MRLTSVSGLTSRPAPAVREAFSPAREGAAFLWLRQAPYALFTLAVLAMAWLA